MARSRDGCHSTADSNSEMGAERYLPQCHTTRALDSQSAAALRSPMSLRYPRAAGGT